MLDKLRGSKTIVTEHRTYIVDSISRKGISRAAVSARTEKFSEQDIEITPTKQHSITLPTKGFLQISTTFPVIATFNPLPLSDAEDGTDVLPKPPFTTAEILVDGTVDTNGTLIIGVYDPDVTADTVKVTAFNTRTGETEILTLLRVDADTFTASLPIEHFPYKGIDFDCTMFAQPGDIIRLFYRDAFTPDGKVVNIQRDVLITSSFVQPRLYVRKQVAPKGTIGICVLNSGVTEPIAKVRNMRTGSTQELVLMPTESPFPEFTIHSTAFTTQADDAPGDVLQVFYFFTDEFGNTDSLNETIVITSQESLGVLSVPNSITTGGLAVIELNDADVITDYVDLVISGNQTNRFSRVRAVRLAEFVGLYMAVYSLEDKFADDQSLTVTYADPSEGITRLVKRPMTIHHVVATPEAVQVPVELVNAQLAMQMEINGLFTLNGSFTGTVTLAAKRDETVRCTIIQAS